ncbi:MAG: type IV pilus assembly protein PilM [Armatimonadetes bacterium]|nr:type IV pilus assembly protein PilM [Armatimonadota bacterium]
MPITLKNPGGPIVGLDIGSNLIKVCQAQLRAGRPEVTALAVLPTPPEAVTNNEIVDPVALGKALRALLGQAGIKGRHVVTSVAGQNAVVVRIIEVPKMTPAELRETMKWEVERHIPFPADQVELDFQPLSAPEEVPEGANMEVLLAVAQEQVIARHIEALQAAGLEPKVIDIEPLASQRSLLVLGNGESAPGSVAIIDLGATSTDINIFRGGRIAFTRTIQIAGNSLTKAISDVLGQPLAQAEQLKQDMAAVPEDAAFAEEAGVDPLAGLGAFDFNAAAGGGAGAGFGAAPAAPATGEPGVDIAAGGFAPSAFTETTEGPIFETGPMPTVGGPGGTAPGGAPAGAVPFDAGLAGPTPAASPFASPFDTGPAPEALTGAPAAPARFPAPTAGGGDEYRRTQIADAILPVLGELVTELRRSLDFFRNRANGDGVHQVLICGGTAKLPGLASFLQRNLGVPVAVASGLEHVGVTARCEPAYVQDVGPIFPVSVGLAVREMLIEAPAPRARR